MKPKFITFTGVDQFTDIGAMEYLSSEYPIEWGILFSPKRQGIENRYPPIPIVRQIVSALPRLKFSAHLCGGDAREVIEDGASRHDTLITSSFQRSQINSADPKVQPSIIAQWAKHVDVIAILQCRCPFPKSSPVDVLYDPSGGRGREPSSWPQASSAFFTGYAGGINPDNASRIVKSLPHGGNQYWIDMESGVRDENDRFDLGKVRAVCKAIYG